MNIHGCVNIECHLSHNYNSPCECEQHKIKKDKAFHEMVNSFKEYFNQEIKYLIRSRYSGKGRPKKSDYVLIKRKEIPDYQAAEILNNAFTTTFI